MEISYVTIQKLNLFHVANHNKLQYVLCSVFCLFLRFILICICLLCGVCHMYVGALRSQRALDTLELELQAIVSHQCGFWELNLGLLEELQVLLASGYLSSPFCFLKKEVSLYSSD